MKSKGIYLGLSLFFALFLSLSPSVSAGQKPTHIVKNGDTLWSICEQYYGDPYLWPELWEMNKFITNPHWLMPGDVIKLLKYVEKKSKPEKKIVKTKKLPLRKQTLKKLMGIDVSSLTNTKALGFLRQEKIEAWGKIFDFKTDKVLAGENDIAYVKMYQGDIKPGEKFIIYNILGPVNHPLTKKEFGYIYSFKGILEIKEAQKDYHIAKISESFRSIYKDSLLMPYRPVSSCILPVPWESPLTAYIVAAKDNLNLLGQYSVVYIDAGQNRGISRGNLLNATTEREYTSTDEQEKETVALPPTIIGKILILDTTENTSTGVVFWALKDFTNGVKVRPQTWHNLPRELANLPPCPVE